MIPVGSYQHGGWLDPVTHEFTPCRPADEIRRWLPDTSNLRFIPAPDRMQRLERIGDALEACLPAVAVLLAGLMLWAVLA